MLSEWITGKELMERYGLQPAEIGEMCCDDRLKPYDHISLVRVYDFGPIEKYRQDNADKQLALLRALDKKIEAEGEYTPQLAKERAEIKDSMDWPPDLPDGHFRWLKSEDYINTEYKKHDQQTLEHRNNPRPTRNKLFDKYKKRMADLLFKRSEIGVLLNFQSSVQEVRTDTKEREESAQALDNDVQDQIEKWTSIFPLLFGKENTAAKLVIEKWLGKSHIEADVAVRGDTGIEMRSHIDYVSGALKLAQEIALRPQYSHLGLRMPPNRKQHKHLPPATR